MYIEEAYLDEIREEVMKLLKAAGIKIGLKKQDMKPEGEEDDIRVYKVFQTSLEFLEKERVHVQQSEHPIEVPVFVSDACQFIRKDLNIEGLFRKAGSAAKQRELKTLLDSGSRLELNDDQSIINVANTLKMFLRELPEPLIPHKFHSLFLRCLNCKGNQIQTILWACLLLPYSHLNTLVYLMQFLSEGGAMINQRMKIVQILLRNSLDLGVVPETICERLGLFGLQSFSSVDDLDSSANRRKRRKKRSSSLTRVITGIKKMITKPSPDILDSTPCANRMVHTPKIMPSKKKDCGSTFSTKKKLRVLNALPDNAFFGNTPRKVKYSSTSMLTPRTIIPGPEAPAKVVRHNSSAERKRKISIPDEVASDNSETTDKNPSIVTPPHQGYEDLNEDDFISVRKDYIEDINNRVSLLECQLQAELDLFSSQPMNDNGLDDMLFLPVDPPTAMDSLFNPPIQESRSFMDLQMTGEFDGRKRQVPIRSPSARKIGSFRNKRRITRHSSLKTTSSYAPRQGYSTDVHSSLRRGRPNTLFSGLPQPCNPLYASDSHLPSSPRQRLSECKSAKNRVPLENIENNFPKGPAARLRDEVAMGESRRSSINYIRQRQAGMVLQRAKLFGDVKHGPTAEHDSRRNTGCVVTPPPKRICSPRTNPRERSAVIGSGPGLSAVLSAF
ncbi:RhoGAP [Nesidiocoris tenuis]|uniref:RhoGAP n=1 Tax=Nesidiocoris tenuis TaxID=355587 RepID=A0ABN7AH35_9HEMI|nr:RhoGAP [Nesidiocoris tenuis]